MNRNERPGQNPGEWWERLERHLRIDPNEGWFSSFEMHKSEAKELHEYILKLEKECDDCRANHGELKSMLRSHHDYTEMLRRNAELAEENALLRRALREEINKNAKVREEV